MAIKLSTIPQVYRNARRLAEIATVLSRNGLEDWIGRLGLDQLVGRAAAGPAAPAGDGAAAEGGAGTSSAAKGLTYEARVRKTLGELGPTFIKLGQILSTRPELVGGAMAHELRHLQTATPANGEAEIRAVLVEEFGRPVEEVFARFDPVPLASASMAQVHRAVLTDGRQVVVKVQHPGIERQVAGDLDLLHGIARLAEALPEIAPYRPTKSAEEIGRSLRKELDFTRDARNLEQFLEFYDRDPAIHAPRPVEAFCTRRVLVQEYLEGTPIGDREALVAAGYDLPTIARNGARIYLDMIFSRGFYHADPHPGNILILPGGVIGLLDFGMVGRLDETLRESFEEMLLAIVSHDTALLSVILRRIGKFPSELDEGEFTSDIAEFVGQYTTRSLDRLDLSGALFDMAEIVRRHRIELPGQVGLLIKTLVTLDGTAKALAPDFNLLEMMRPMRAALLRRRLSPGRNLRKYRRLYLEIEQMAETLPRQIIDIVSRFQEGKFDVHLDVRRLGPSVNRLVLGLLASAVFLGSTLLLSMNVPPVLFPVETYLGGLHRVSLLGLAGLTASVIMGLRLILAILRSGNLDKD